MRSDLPNELHEQQGRNLTLKPLESRFVVRRNYRRRSATVRIWSEPFTELRAPMLTNLRRDPVEKAQHASNTYWDWYMSRIFVIVPLQGIAAEFLKSMQEYPPSQTAGSFNLEKVQKQIEAATGAR